MKFQSQSREELDINVTPLIDVVFLLLIFFMVSTTFSKESELSIELPEAEGKLLQKKEFTLEVDIDAQGRFFVNRQRVIDSKVVTLKRALTLTMGTHNNPQVVINADRSTPYQAVITAMDASRQLGLVNLTFATKQTEEQR